MGKVMSILGGVVIQHVQTEPIASTEVNPSVFIIPTVVIVNKGIVIKYYSCKYISICFERFILLIFY